MQKAILFMSSSESLKLSRWLFGASVGLPNFFSISITHLSLAVLPFSWYDENGIGGGKYRLNCVLEALTI